MTNVKKVKTIKVDLLPKDFVDNHFSNYEDCPLARAATRYFKEYTEATEARLFVGGTDSYNPTHLIPKEFNNTDYEFVKEQYEKDPKAEKVIYYVELIPVK